MITLDVLKKTFPQCQEIHKNIFLITDFISEEDRILLMSMAQNASEDDWRKDYIESLDDIKYDINYPWHDKALNIDSSLGTSLRDEIKSAIGKDYLIQRFGTIQRHYPGSSLAEHSDRGYNREPEYAIVLYLNDDYLGGELYFSKFNIEFKFPKGSMVVFATGDDYMHGVKEVLEGPTRYVITSFIFNNIGPN
jgi:hypothetical protein